jgi:hypothetical protein
MTRDALTTSFVLAALWLAAFALGYALAGCEAPLADDRRALCCDPYDAGERAGCRPTMVDRDVLVPAAFVDDSRICADEGWVER